MREADDAVGDPDQRLVDARPQRPVLRPARAARRRRSSSGARRAAGRRSTGRARTTFASRAISRLYGSMFDDPTVAQWSSITATFACRNDWWYSWIVDARTTAAGRTTPASRSAAADTRRAPAAAASPPRRAAPPRSARGGSGCPGKKYELAIRISRFAVRIAARYACSMSRRWRRLSRITNFAVCAPARCARRGAGNNGTSLCWNCTSSLIAQTRCIVRTIGTSSGPSMRSAKSTRGGFCPGVFTSSMMLMPPTKAILPSTWQSLRCSRRNRLRAELPWR